MQRNHFDTEHNLFRDAFAAFLDKEVVPHQEAWEEAGVVDRSVWRKAGEMGFLLPWADEEYGGAGLKDFRYEQIMCEELARINEPGFASPATLGAVRPLYRRVRQCRAEGAPAAGHHQR